MRPRALPGLLLAVCVTAGATEYAPLPGGRFASVLPADGKTAPVRLRLLAVSFDPARDDADALTRYAAKHRLDTRWWTLVRTEPQNVRPLAALLGVQYGQLPDGDFNHSSVRLLLDADGRVAARSTVSDRTDPDFVAAVRKLAAQ